MKKKWFVWVPLAVLAFALFLAVGGQVVRLLWNALLPPLFGWPTVTFWQALGLLVLCRILFGGFGGGGTRRSGVGRRVAERMEHMTPEERERLRQLVRERWGAASGAGGADEGR